MTRAAHDAIGWMRDAVQCRILAQVFAQRIRGIAVKGGMAMRVAHWKCARATKDIDLNATSEMPLSTLQGIIRGAIHAATRDGLLQDVKITEPKQTGVTARWKISGLDPRSHQKLHLTVEVSRREMVDDHDVHDIIYGPVGKGEFVTVYKDQVLAFQKIRALLDDTRDAPRDIADLYLLIQASIEPPIRQLRAAFKDGGLSKIADMWAKIDRMDQAMFRSEVLPSLPPSPDGQELYKDWESIRLTVGEHVEKWIRAAQNDDSDDEAPSSEELCHTKHIHHTRVHR